MLASSRLKSMQMPSLMHKGAVDEVQMTLSRSSSFSMKRSSITWLNKDRTDEDIVGSRLVEWNDYRKFVSMPLL